MKSKNITLFLLSITLVAHASRGENGQKRDSTHSSGRHSAVVPHTNHVTGKSKQKSSVTRGGFGSTGTHGAGG